MAITLSIRNIDLDADITLSEVNYYGSKGKLIESFVEDPPSVKPQESVRFVIAEGDEGGGSGANFIVKWKSATEVNPPIIESIMIDGFVKSHQTCHSREGGNLQPSDNT